MIRDRLTDISPTVSAANYTVYHWSSRAANTSREVSDAAELWNIQSSRKNSPYYGALVVIVNPLADRRLDQLGLRHKEKDHAHLSDFK